MFKKIKDLFGIQALKESWKKLLKKSNDIGQGYLDYEYEYYEDKYMQNQVNLINNNEDKKDGNLE